MIQYLEGTYQNAGSDISKQFTAKEEVIIYIILIYLYLILLG